MLETVVDLNPLSSTATLYSPGSISGKAYNPSLLVEAWRTSAVAIRVSVTWAPAITDPLLSVTSPPISVELVWAHSGTTQTAKQTTRAARISAAPRRMWANKLENRRWFI